MFLGRPQRTKTMAEITLKGSHQEFEDLKIMFDAFLARQDRIEDKLDEIFEILSQDEDQCQG